MGEISHYWSRPFCRSGKKWYLWVWSRGLQYSIIWLCCTFLSLIAQTVMHCTMHLYCIVFCQSGTKKLQYILTFLSLIALCCIVFYQFGKEMIFMGSMERVPTKLHSIAIFFNSTAQYRFASAMCMHDMHNMQMSNIFGTYSMYCTVLWCSASCSALWWNEFQAETALLLPKLQRQ